MATLPDLSGLTPEQLHRAIVKAQSVTIVDLLDSLPWFKGGADWTAWRAFLCAAYAVPMSEQEYAYFQRHTGRKDPPKRQVSRVWMPVGRRGRKSAIGALMGVYHGAFRDYGAYLAPGETAWIPILAKNKAEAHQIRDYAAAILSAPALKHLTDWDAASEEITTEEIRLSTRVTLKIRAAAIMAGRGHAIPLALLDELAFFRSEESANPDEEIIRGITPGMATIPGAMLAGMSSPYSRRGVLWHEFREWYGVESDDVLVWQADTVSMHDTPQIRTFVQMEYDKDATSASAEFGAQFRADLEAFVPIEVVEACTATGVSERQPLPDVVYYGFVDPSGGTADSMTLAIAHWDGATKVVVQDALYEWRPEPNRPFDPDVVVGEAAAHLARYRVKTIEGDNYGGEWPKQRFWARGIHYERCEEPRSRLYLELLPLMTAKQVLLLDNKRLKAQLVALDRRTGRGRDSIDHPPGGHDDLPNAVAGVTRVVDQRRPKLKDPVKPVAKTLEEVQANAFRDRVKEMLSVEDEGSVPERYRHL